MYRNLINRQDLTFLLRSLRTGSLWRRLKGRFLGNPPSYFWNIAAVGIRANTLITGDPELDYTAYVAQKYLKSGQPLTGLSLGCGSGQKELTWTSRCRFAVLDAYDLSPSRIAYARDQAQAAGRTEINYQVGNASELALPTARYDVAFVDQALHHFSPLEPLLLRIRRALKQEGYLIASEFIGPSRFQWTDRQLEVINGALAILPHRFRRRWSDGSLKIQVRRPSWLTMTLGDPSEAVESARIVPLLEKHFEIVERRDYGGTVVHMLFDDIAANFVDETGSEKDEEARQLLQLCFQIEDTLLELGELESDFALFVCKPGRLGYAEADL
jgi:SAM-dependent methyltransferase